MPPQRYTIRIKNPKSKLSRTLATITREDEIKKKYPNQKQQKKQRLKLTSKSCNE